MQYFRKVEGTFRQAQAEFRQRKHDDEKAHQDAQDTQDAQGSQDAQDGTNDGLPDVSPSALPTTASQLQPMVLLSAAAATSTDNTGDTPEDTPQGTGDTGDSTMSGESALLALRSLRSLQSFLPGFVAACEAIQSDVTALSTVEGVRGSTSVPPQGGTGG